MSGRGSFDKYGRVTRRQPLGQVPLSKLGSINKPSSNRPSFAEDVANLAGLSPDNKRATAEIQSQLGRVQVGDRIVSARLLNRDLALDFAVAQAMPSDELVNEMLVEVKLGPVATDKLSEPITGGGKRRQRGGADTWADWGNAKIAFTKAIILMGTSPFASLALEAGVVLKAGWDRTEETRKEAVQAVAGYFIQEFAPLGEVGGKFAKIIVYLLEQLAIKTPITLIMLLGSGAAYTLNVVRYILDMSNQWARRKAEGLLSDETAASAAAAALDSVKSVGTTAAIGVFVANQVGVLPMSAVLAAILWSLQVNLGTGGGRAYLVTGFYAWYKSQSPEFKGKFKEAAQKYAADAKSAAELSATDAKVKVTAAAAVLGPLLAQAGAGAGAAGKNAFQSVAAAITKAIPGSPAPTIPQDGTAALKDGAPAAAIAAGAETVAETVKARRRSPRARAPVGADADGDVEVEGGRRKTKKRTSKRRVTRRRKAQKVLGTPVFIY